MENPGFIKQILAICYLPKVDKCCQSHVLPFPSGNVLEIAESVETVTYHNQNVNYHILQNPQKNFFKGDHF